MGFKFREKSDQAVKINFRGFNFRDCRTRTSGAARACHDDVIYNRDVRDRTVRESTYDHAYVYVHAFSDPCDQDRASDGEILH